MYEGSKKEIDRVNQFSDEISKALLNEFDVDEQIKFLDSVRDKLKETYAVRLKSANEIRDCAENNLSLFN